MRLSLLSGLSVVYKRESSAYDDLLYRISKRNRSDLSKSDHPETKISPSKSSSKGRPGDWRVQCTRDWHLHQYLLENRATLTEEFGWATREDKVAFGCRPASRYTGAPYEKMHNIKFNCTVCHRRKEIPMTHARALAALVTPAYHMWKLCENDANGRRTYEASHHCNTKNCVNQDHISMELRWINSGPRKRHQHGTERCDCESHGRKKCIGLYVRYTKQKVLDELWPGSLGLLGVECDDEEEATDEW